MYSASSQVRGFIITDTIFALSSAPGRAGVAVIRVSGPKARTVGDLMAGVAGRPLEERRVRYTAIRHPISGALLDRGLAVWFPTPMSFTGEDVLEFQVHGGLAVVQAFLDALEEISDCRMAEPGEFTRRAFAAGKLDLAEVEGLADLIDAQTEAQRVQALSQAGGGLSRIYEDWRARLIKARAVIEAVIDFSDEEDVAISPLEDVTGAVAALNGDILKHLHDGNRGEIVRDGFKIVIAGAPNVGKSSLLNGLARRDAAIVSSQAGTTRDVVEVRLDLGGYAVVVSDTAGIREASGEIEVEGIRRSIERVKDADLVLWMIDLSDPSGPPPVEVLERLGPVMVVLNKSDLVERVDEDRIRKGWPPGARKWLQSLGETISVCAVSPGGIGELTTRLTQIVCKRIGETGSPVLSRARHRAQLSACQADLNAFLKGTHGGEIELQAELLRTACDALGRITGRVDVEDVLDEVFGQFCIGK